MSFERKLGDAFDEVLEAEEEAAALERGEIYEKKPSRDQVDEEKANGDGNDPVEAK
tara:strand:+ start:718 stop:885 length:168 start_codon:yes stop_codon:yes gene_type:complete